MDNYIEEGELSKAGELKIFPVAKASSGAAYYPKAETVNDKKSYPIKVRSYEVPKFADGEDYAVQQGAGMVVTKSSDKEVYASIQFLKWFTEAKRNFEFAATSSYLPVKKEANTEKAVEKAMKDEKNEDIKDTVLTASKQSIIIRCTLRKPRKTEARSEIFYKHVCLTKPIRTERLWKKP